MSQRWVHLAAPEGVELRPVPGYEPKYFAGSDGCIYCHSDAASSSKKPKPYRMATHIGGDGYPVMALLMNGKRRNSTVHPLVCAAFHGPRPSTAHQVRHLDGVRTNNLPGNLRWGTHAENEADKRRHGTNLAGERHPNAKLTDEAVRILRASIPRGLWNTSDAAKTFGVDASVIREIVSGKAWRHVDARVGCNLTKSDMTEEEFRAGERADIEGETA